MNAAISSSVVLASRLPDDLSVFSLVLFAVQLFALFPLLRHRFWVNISFLCHCDELVTLDGFTGYVGSAASFGDVISHCGVTHPRHTFVDTYSHNDDRHLHCSNFYCPRGACLGAKIQKACYLNNLTLFSTVDSSILLQ